jgi:hypothetical protein
MARHKNTVWNLPEGTPSDSGSTTHSWDSIHAALLMDVRDELREMNSRLSCSRIPRALDAVVRLEKRLAPRYPLRRRKAVSTRKRRNQS